jgi:hypothetical protein
LSILNPAVFDEDGIEKAKKTQTRPVRPLDVFDTERYLKDPNKCMFCGSTNIDAGFFEADGRVGSQKVKCSDCDGQWQDIFELTDVGDIYGPSGKYLGGG